MSDISKIIDYLYIGAWNSGFDNNRVNELQIKLVISTILYRPSLLEDSDTKILWLPSFDFRYLPIPLKFLKQGSKAAAESIRKGESVLVYCKEGRHRSVAMTACVLIRLGYNAEEAAATIKQARGVADPEVDYIYNRIKLFEKYYLSKKSDEKDQN